MTLRRLLAVLVGLLSLALVIAAPSSAQEDEGDSLTDAPSLIRAIDSRDPANVQLQLMYGGDDIDTVQVTGSDGELQTGEAVAFSATEGEMELVIVFDTGKTMDSSGGLLAAKDAAKEIVAAKAPNEKIALVAASDQGVVVQQFSASTERLVTSIDAVAPSAEGGVALWDAVSLGANLFTKDAQATMIVVTSGLDNVNPAARGKAEAALGSAGGVALVVGLQNDALDPGTFEALVESTGGNFSIAKNPDEVREGVQAAGSWLVDNQFVVPFATDVESGVAGITVQIGDTSIEAGYVPGNLEQGAALLEPFDPRTPSGIEFLQGGAGLILMLVLIFVAVGLGIYALVNLVVKDEGALSNVLQPYSEGYAGDGDDDEESNISSSAIIQRAVDFTEEFAESRGLLTRAEGALERANLPLRAAEALFFYAVIVVVLTLIGLFLTRSLFAGLIIGGLGALIPLAAVNFIAARRKKQFQALLPETLQLLSGTLRAGYSLMQGVEAVSQEVGEPMGHELQRVVTEARLGRPLEESLDSVAERMASPDFAWAVMAIRIQREVGGNLSELLLTVADTMTQRERLRRDINSLTAEGRVSAMVLGLLPVGLGLAMFAINPKYISVLFDTTLGNILLGVAIVGMGIGFAWMRQIIKIEI